jgi:large subunit ribosomal protein L32e
VTKKKSGEVTEEGTSLNAHKTIMAMLQIRKRQKKKKPHFIQEESWRYKRIHAVWRRPKGIDSAMRFKRKSRPKSVEIGYRSPKIVRGFHPSGFQEVLVHNIKELENINSECVVRISHTVGLRKKLLIIEKAKELGLRVLNAGRVDTDES